MVDEDTRVCDICGAADAMIRTMSTPDEGIINELSGYTCQKCLDEEKEEPYICDLMDELETNKRLKKLLYDRFAQIRMQQKGMFISDHGLGVKGERCEICGANTSYLCIVEDHYPNNRIEMLDELSMWCCADCISMGRQKTRMENEFIAFMHFRIQMNAIYEKLKACANNTELNDIELTPEILDDMVNQESDYEAIARVMEKARFSYTGVPVKTIIKTAEKGERCFCCGEICGKDHECSVTK